MSRICLAIGFASKSSPLELVYLGRSATEMRQAVERSTLSRLILVPFVQGIPKNNSRAALNEAAAVAADALEADELTNLADLEKDFAHLQQLLASQEHVHANLRSDLEAANARIFALQAANESLAVANAIAASDRSTAAGVATVRAKFSCTEVSDNGGDVAAVSLMPVYSGSPENAEFFKWTPGGSIQLQTVNRAAAALFQRGGEYYVDFSRAPIESPVAEEPSASAEPQPAAEPVAATEPQAPAEEPAAPAEQPAATARRRR